MVNSLHQVDKVTVRRARWVGELDGWLSTDE